MVISRCSPASEILHNFHVNFSNMIGIANVKVIPIKFLNSFSSVDNLKIANKIQLIDALLMSTEVGTVMFSSIQPTECFQIVLFSGSSSYHVKFYKGTWRLLSTLSTDYGNLNRSFLATTNRSNAVKISPFIFLVLKHNCSAPIILQCMDNSCHFLMDDTNSVLGNSMPLTSKKKNK